MAMGPMPTEEGQSNPGGASQLVAKINSDMMKLQDMIAAKLPEDASALAQIIQAYQGFVESLSGAPGGEKQGPPMPGTTTPEAGAANVKQAM